MFKTRLMLAFAGLLTFVFLLAGLLYWSVNQTNDQVSRIQLAHAELESYLSLSAETYRLFKQFRRIMLDDGSADIDVVADDRARLEDRIRRLRVQIAEETAFVSTDRELRAERIELQRLDALTGEIQQALDDVGRAQQLLRAGRREEAVTLLSEVLEVGIDQRVRGLIDTAVATERGQVAVAEEKVRRLTLRLETAAEIAAALAAAFALLGATLLLRRLSQPIDQLTRGTQKLAAGELSHRIEASGRDEFAQLARRFNSMAADLERQRAQLEDARNTLETKVEERTEALRQANEELQQTDRIRQRFFAEISHELRTPLTVLRGEGEVSLLGGERPAESYKASIARMVDQTEHLSRLVDDLFLMARSSAGVADLKRKEVDVSDLLRKTCDDMAVVAESAGLQLSVRSTEAPTKVLGDRGRLRQLLFILLDNAVRYGRPGDRIDADLTTGDAAAVIRVRDSGPGIAQEDLDRVFDRFYRGTAGRKASPDGSGLGLPLAKSIVDAHGGKIGLDSKDGQGTLVTVTLPIAAAA